MTTETITLAGSPDILLVWPKGRELAAPAPLKGYSIHVLPPARGEWWIDIHRAAVPSFTETKLVEWFARYRALALPEGILVAVDDATGEPVATAGSIAGDRDGMFPRGGQLAWVATIPAHRGRGLGLWLSALATRRLLQDEYKNIFLCTGDDLTPAIRVYLRLGYVPCLYASDQRERWERICAAIDHPFTPDVWPTPEVYVDSLIK